jgi:hypothetical protein
MKNYEFLNFKVLLDIMQIIMIIFIFQFFDKRLLHTNLIYVINYNKLR